MRNKLKNYLKYLGNLHFKYSILTFAITLVGAIIFSYQGKYLEIGLTLSKLLPDHAPSVVEMNEVIGEVGGSGHLIIFLGPKDNPEKYLKPLSEKINNMEEVKYSFYEQERYSLKDKVLYLISKEEFKKIKKHARAIFNDGKTSMINLGLDDEQSKKQKIQKAKDYFLKFNEKYNTKRYFSSKDGKFVLLLVKPKFDSTDLEKSQKFNKKIDTLIKTILPKDVPYHLLGRYVEKVKNRKQLEKDIAKTATISFVALAIILVLGLGTFRGALITVAGTMIALGFTVGWAHFLVGQINILTSFLLAILGGLGAEYGIHLMRHFYRMLDDGKNNDEAKILTYRKMGRSLLSAAVTSAAAFLILYPSDFRGFSELGIISGLGILSIYVVYMLAFPLFVKIIPKKVRFKKLTDIFGFYPVEGNWILLIPVFLLITAWGFTKAKFEYNFQKMQDLSDEIMYLNNFTEKLFGKALTPSAILVKDKENVKEVTDWLRSDQSKTIISDAVSIPLLIPTDMKSRYRQIKKLNKLISRVSDQEITEKTSLNPSEIRQWLQQKPYSKKDLPIQLQTAFGKSGNIILAYPKEDQAFAENLRRLASLYKKAKSLFLGLLIGSDTVIFVEIIDHIVKDGKIVLLVFLLGAFFIFWLDFKDLTSALILESQLILGIYLLISLMGLFNVKFTILNVAMVPAVLAAGIDMGVHVRHKILEGVNPLQSAKVLAQAITLSAVTTMVGFGSLFFAEATMLKGIAWISVLGQVSMYLSSMVISPLIANYFYIKKNRIL